MSVGAKRRSSPFVLSVGAQRRSRSRLAYRSPSTPRPAAATLRANGFVSSKPHASPQVAEAEDRGGLRVRRNCRDHADGHAPSPFFIFADTGMAPQRRIAPEFSR